MAYTLYAIVYITLFVSASPVFAGSLQAEALKYVCEGKTLKIECGPEEVIKVIRANYGRLSSEVCSASDDVGEVSIYSTHCLLENSLRVLDIECSYRQNCSILATNSVFGDPCYGTTKYLEVVYQCIPGKLNKLHIFLVNL